MWFLLRLKRSKCQITIDSLSLPPPSLPPSLSPSLTPSPSLPLTHSLTLLVFVQDDRRRAEEEKARREAREKREKEAAERRQAQVIGHLHDDVRWC